MTKWPLILILVLASFSLQAERFRVGFSFLEGGDNLLTGGSYLSYIKQDKSLDLQFFQKSKKLFTVQTSLLSINKQFSHNNYLVQLGLSFLINQTHIHLGSSETELKDSELNYNLGGVFGFAYQFPFGSKWDLQLQWISHLYPAGISAIVLVTGRKETLTLALGRAI